MQPLREWRELTWPFKMCVLRCPCGHCPAGNVRTLEFGSSSGTHIHVLLSNGWSRHSVLGGLDVPTSVKCPPDNAAALGRALMWSTRRGRPAHRIVRRLIARVGGPRVPVGNVRRCKLAASKALGVLRQALTKSGERPCDKRHVAELRARQPALSGALL